MRAGKFVAAVAQTRIATAADEARKAQHPFHGGEKWTRRRESNPAGGYHPRRKAPGRGIPAGNVRRPPEKLGISACIMPSPTEHFRMERGRHARSELCAAFGGEVSRVSRARAGRGFGRGGSCPCVQSTGWRVFGRRFPESAGSVSNRISFVTWESSLSWVAPGRWRAFSSRPGLPKVVSRQPDVICGRDPLRAGGKNQREGWMVGARDFSRAPTTSLPTARLRPSRQPERW